MKFILFLSIIILTFTGCSVTPIPNPGFRVVTIRRDGSFERPLPGSVTRGTHGTDLLSPTGEVRSFYKTGGNSGQFDVNGGRAPSAWYIEAISNWDRCTGQSAYIDLERGELNYITCTAVRIQFRLNPSVVYSTGEPFQLQGTVYGVNTNNGMPTLHFEDYSGQVVAVTQATEVTGNTISVSSSCLLGKPLGTYTVKVYNASTEETEPIGVSQISIQREYRDPCDPLSRPDSPDPSRPNCPD
jgi:hypothetical protein